MNLLELVDKFNVVIEGSYNNEFNSHFAKIAFLEIPQKVRHIRYEHNERYILIGETADFDVVKRANLSDNHGDFNLSRSLSYSDGLVLQELGEHPLVGITNILDIPRAVYTREGRIFVGENWLKDQNYMRVVTQGLARGASQIFTDGELIKRVKRDIKTLTEAITS